MDFRLEQAMKFGCPHCALPQSKMIRSKIHKEMFICPTCGTKTPQHKLRQITLIPNTQTKSVLIPIPVVERDIVKVKAPDPGRYFDHRKQRDITPTNRPCITIP